MLRIRHTTSMIYLGLLLLLAAAASWHITARRSAPRPAAAVVSDNPGGSVRSTAQADVTTSLPEAFAALARKPDQAMRECVNELYTQLPLRFEANHGQLDSEVKYHARGPATTCF